MGAAVDPTTALVARRGSEGEHSSSWVRNFDNQWWKLEKLVTSSIIQSCNAYQLFAMVEDGNVKARRQTTSGWIWDGSKSRPHPVCAKQKSTFQLSYVCNISGPCKILVIEWRMKHKIVQPNPKSVKRRSTFVNAHTASMPSLPVTILYIKLSIVCFSL